MLVRILICIIPFIAIAQNTPLKLLTTGVNICAGNGVVETNASISHHLSISRHDLFFIHYGCNLSFISNENQLYFKSPTNLDPSFNVNDGRMNFVSLNLHFGFRLAITKQLYLGSNIDLLGISFGKKIASNMMSDNKAYPYEATVMPTNFLLKGVDGGNLFHTIELIYISEGLLSYKIGLANQSITYDYTSTMPQYNSFSMLKFAYMGLVGIEWKIPCR